MKMSDIQEPVSIIIPVFMRRDIFATMRFLHQQDYFPFLRIIVIDNGNPPELSEELKKLESANCHVIRFSKNCGGAGAYIAGVNHAMQAHAETRSVWLLDDDAEINSRTLPALLETLKRKQEENEPVAGVGSTIISRQHPGVIIETGVKFHPRKRHKYTPINGGKALSDIKTPEIHSVDYCAATSLLITKDAVKKYGFFADVFLHGDDIEWGYRVTHRYGGTLYAITDSNVIHPEFNISKSGNWIRYYDVRNLFWLLSLYDKTALYLEIFFRICEIIYYSLHGDYIYPKLYIMAYKDFRKCKLRHREEICVSDPMNRPDWESWIKQYRRIFIITAYPLKESFYLPGQHSLQISKVFYKKTKNDGIRPAAILQQLFLQIRSLWRPRDVAVLFDHEFHEAFLFPFYHRNKIFFNFSEFYDELV